MIDREGRAGTVDSRQPGDCAAPAHAETRAAAEAMILPLTGEVSLEAGGGKAANLARLARAGFAVPSGFVMTTRAYRDFVSANDLEDWILETARAPRSEEPASLDAASMAIRTRFASAAMPPEVVDTVRAAYAALGCPPVAVRSSATTEDLPDLSFAGQQDTMLNVIGDAALMRAVVQCWSSLWTARAIGYRARNGIAHEGAALAVVVQQMVASEASGVMFTANPLTGKRSETVIDATLGLGEALVSGRVEPDHYVIDPLAGHVLERRIGAKALSVRACAQGGTAEVREDAAGRATLTDAAAVELASLGRRVAMLFGTPQDIEWAQAIGRYSLLQARPITSLFPLPETLPTDGLHVLISFGAVQGMLDPIKPLGRDVFCSVLPRALAPLGGPLASARRPIVAGERIFFDITAAVRNPRRRPHLRSALRVIEPATGEALDEVLADARSVPAAPQRRWRAPSARLLLLLARALGNLTYNLLWPERGRARIQRRLSAAIAAFERRSAAAHSLAERVTLLEQALAWAPHIGLPLLFPGFGAGLASLRLLYVLAADLPDGERRVLELTRGLPHNVTTEMDLALWDVARTIRGDKGAAAVVSASDAGALAREGLAGRLPPTAQTAIDAFLRRYGMRGVGEIDLGRPRWREDPTPLMQALQSYMRIEEGEQAPDVVFRRGAETAERALASLMADARRTRFGWLKVFVMRRAARRMRALAGLRESPKFTVMAMLGAVRAALLASGHELTVRGILDSPDDIFFLHLDEVNSLAAGDTRDWRSIVRERRRLYAREARRRRVPRLLLTDGRVFFGGTGGGERNAGSSLTGTPVSPGVVVGLVRVVFDPGGAQLMPGEILVCRGTDPAWTPLFLAAGGLVTEVGGLMTHGSVVAREYGIPAVVGVHEATTRLRTGARVRVDGTNGRITVLDP
jgi:phosphohistidine swiveling domain-containing protein